MDDKTETFERHRRRLFGLAYRMLGVVGDAEDAVQDTWLRWHRADAAKIQVPEAWLVTACTRLCIDRLRAAKTERAHYTGTWLPEPLVELEVSAAPDAVPGELADDLSMALLVVLERLSPAERAAWLLREAFDYDYPQLAATLKKTEAACRQLVSRAQKHLQEARPRFAAEASAARDLAARFMAATQAGDPGAIAGLLAGDAMLWSDGGGKAHAALNIIHGADKVARFFAGVSRKRPAGTRMVPCQVNRQPGLAFYDADNHAFMIWTLDIAADRTVRNVFVVRNPDKLARVPVL